MSVSVGKEKKITRREFLKMSGAATAGVVLGSALSMKAMAHGKPKTKQRYAMAIDLRRCIGCHACSVTCKAENDVPLGVWRSWVKLEEKGTYPDTKRYFLPRLCNHCENAPCVKVCPSGASHYGDGGLVLVDEKKCVGCKLCIAACPYKSRFTHPVKRITDKCDLCRHRIEKDVVPACVNACMGRARIFGDLNDSDSEISKLLAGQPAQVLKPELGTEPHCFYIGAEEALTRG